MRQLLVLLYFALCAGIALNDLGHRRGGFSRFAALFQWGLIALWGLSIFGSTAERFPAIAPGLAGCGALFVAFGVAGLRTPGNPAGRFALLFTAGSVAATLTMLAVIAATGTQITDPAPHARAWVGLLFADVLLGVPVLLSIVDRAVLRGFIAAYLQRQAAHPAGSGSLRHGPASVLPRATLHLFVPRQSPDEVRRRLAQAVAPLEPHAGRSTSGYHGVVPEAGAFSLTRYVVMRGVPRPETFDVETAPLGEGTELVLHAREGVGYLIAASPVLMALGISLSTSWTALWGEGMAHVRAVNAVEISTGITLVIAMGTFLLFHSMARGALAEDRKLLAAALNAEIPHEGPSRVGALFRLSAALGFAGFVVLAVVSMGALAIGGALDHNREIMFIGLGCLGVHGLIFWAIGHAARSYYRGGWRQDLAVLRGGETSVAG
jgi:hypothetical protein